MTTGDTQDNISRVVDFRIPLPWLLSGVAGITWALISMWFSVNQLVKTVDELQITVKSGNTSVVAVAGELALLKFRLTNTEDEQKRVVEAIRQIQAKAGK
jgi:hypothetical protein